MQTFFVPQDLQAPLDAFSTRLRTSSRDTRETLGRTIEPINPDIRNSKLHQRIHTFQRAVLGDETRRAVHFVEVRRRPRDPRLAQEKFLQLLPQNAFYGPLAAVISSYGWGFLPL